MEEEFNLNVKAEIVREDGRDYAKLSYKDACVKKQLPLHLKKLPKEEVSWHVSLIFTELEIKMARKLGIKFKYVHSASKEAQPLLAH